MIYEYGGYVLKKIRKSKVNNEIELEEILLNLQNKFHYTDKILNIMLNEQSDSNPIESFEITNNYDEEYLDDFNYYSDSNSSRYETIYIRETKNHFLFILNHDYDIYVCDYCNKYKFYDYKKKYHNMKIRFNVIDDKCPKCYKKTSVRRLEKINGVPASKQQIYLSKLFNGELNYQINDFFVDILIEDKNIIIEYDGSGHYIKTFFDKSVTKEDLITKDLIRDETLQNEGYKVIRIASENDYLPQDEELFIIFNNALDLFEKGEKFYRVFIDKEYDNDKLRKISEEDLIGFS